MHELRLENKKLKLNQGMSVKSSGGKGGKSSGKGSKAGKSKKEGSRIPKELLGLKRDFEGKSFCFGFNLEGCPEGSNCKKGVHRCMKCGSSSHGFRLCNE